MGKYYRYLSIWKNYLKHLFKLFGLRYFLLLSATIVSSILQLVTSLAAIKLIALNILSVEYAIIIILLFFFATWGGLLAEQKLLSLSVSYEKYWLCCFILDAHAEKKNINIKQDAKYMSNFFLGTNIILSKLIVSTPIFLILIYFSFELSIILITLSLFSLIPIFLISRTLFRLNNELKESNENDKLISKKEKIPNYFTENTFNIYQKLRTFPLNVKLIIDLLSLFMLSVILFFVLRLDLQLSTAIIYILGCRFLAGCMNSIFSSLAAISKLLTTLDRVQKHYFLRSNFIKAATHKYKLESLFSIDDDKGQEINHSNGGT